MSYLGVEPREVEGAQMARVVHFLSIMLFAIASFATQLEAEDANPVKHTASLAEFGTKVDTLEQIIDDIALSAALGLLGREFPDWTFKRPPAWDDAEMGVSNDLAGVSGRYDYEMSKLRGVIFRNSAVSDEQREQALEIFDEVTEFIRVGYELAGLIDGGQFDQAGALYKGEMLRRYDELKGRIQPLSVEIAQAVKFSAL